MRQHQIVLTLYLGNVAKAVGILRIILSWICPVVIVGSTTNRSEHCLHSDICTCVCVFIYKRAMEKADVALVNGSTSHSPNEKPSDEWLLEDAAALAAAAPELCRRIPDRTLALRIYDREDWKGNTTQSGQVHNFGSSCVLLEHLIKNGKGVLTLQKFLRGGIYSIIKCSAS